MKYVFSPRTPLPFAKRPIPLCGWIDTISGGGDGGTSRALVTGQAGNKWIAQKIASTFGRVRESGHQISVVMAQAFATTLLQRDQ
jgi:hypothetical protein